MRRFLIASGVVGLLAVPAAAQHRHAPAHGTMLEDALPSYAAASQRSRPSFNHRRRMERAGYKKVSSLVNFPSFFPGIGVLYVKPDTLPAGPFLAYDRKDRLVSTIYMIPVDDISIDAPRDSDAWYLALLGRQFPGSWLPYGQEQIVRSADPNFRLVSSESGRGDYRDTNPPWRKPF